MLLALFARADHPLGWGYPQVTSYDKESESYLVKEPHGTGHGYSVMAVKCADENQVKEVSQRLSQGFKGVGSETVYALGWLGDWFGGRFEHLATFPVEDFPYKTPSLNNAGDNKAMAFYDAQEILDN